MQAELRRADSLGAAGQYAEALEVLEAVRTSPSAATHEVREAIALKNQWRLREAEAELLRIDTALRALEGQIETSLEGFVRRDLGAHRLYAHRLLAEGQQERAPHLRVSVDTLGDLQMVSVYVGAKAAEHSALGLSRGGVSARTPDVPHDAALNYRYTDGERHWELVTYPEAHIEALRPVLEGAEGVPLEVELLSAGRSVAGWRLTGSTLSALEETLRLGALLTERQNLRQQQQKYAHRFVRLSQNP